MSNALKGTIAGFVATLVLSGLMILNSTLGVLPEMDIIHLLTVLGTLSVPSAWMDHFIVGVLYWGLLFAAFDAITTRPALWMKGVIFGVIAWLMMMLVFMPLAGAGFFGTKLDIMAVVGLLILHLVYGVVLGATYGFLGTLATVTATANLPREVNSPIEEVVTNGPNPFTMNSADINDHLSSSSPSGRTVLIIFGFLAGFLALLVLAISFAQLLDFE